MFLIRTAFWLMIVILLLPTDAKQQGEIYGTAQAAVKDISGFCDRNPDACAKGKDVLGTFVQKAQFGFQMLTQLVETKMSEARTQTAGAAQPDAGSAADPAAWQPVAPNVGTPDAMSSDDTLNPADLKPAWSGAGHAGT